MGRYPPQVRAAQIKCVACNAPVVTTVDGQYACVSCGEAPVRRKTGKRVLAE